jgi:hypothetical protein
MSASTRPLFETCRVYREAHARYSIAFAKGDVRAIDDAFSRMQEIVRAFRDGADWAESRTMKMGKGCR